jgi:trimeric autotransporter adhesin
VRWCWFLALAVLAGCGRFGFGHRDDAEVDAPIANGDGSTDAGAQLHFSYLKQFNTETFDRFGYAIALSADGTTLAVGAPGEDGNVAGVNTSDGSTNGVSQSGAVYVFVRNGNAWVQQAYIKPQTLDLDDVFGGGVALSGDGNTLAVGVPNEDSNATTIDGDDANNNAPDSGAVFIYTRSGTTWSRQAYIKCSTCEAGDAFGWSVALSGSGDTLAAGAIGEDSDTKLINSTPNNNASGSGAVFIFTRAGFTWSQQTYIKSWDVEVNDQFGSSVDLSSDGKTLAVGAPQEDGGTPGIQQGPYVISSATSEAGAANIYVYDTAWTLQAYIKPSFVGFGGDFFALNLALSNDGNTLVCGAPGEDSLKSNAGAAWVFRRAGTTWSEEARLKASNADVDDQFGATVAIDGTGSNIMVGTPLEDSNASGVGGDETDNSAMDSGAVYEWRHTTSWFQTAYVKGPATDIGDQFGWALAISQDGKTRAATASFEDSAATGIDGDAFDNDAQDSGCAGISFY